MATIAEIRQKYPQYDDLSDTQLADAFHSKFYSDMPKEKFYASIGIKAQEDQSDAETARLKRQAVPKKEKPSVMDQMFGPGSPTYSLVRGAVISPALGVNELLSKLPIFPEQVQKGASNLVRQESQAYEQGREAIGREGFDVPQLVGAVVSPVNRLLPGSSAPTALGRVGQGVAAGAAYGGITPTSGKEDTFVSEKLMQMGLGAVIGGAVPMTIETAKKLTQIVRDLPISQAAKDRALRKYLGDLTGNKPEVAAAALRQADELVAGSKPTAAEALAETPSAARLVREQGRVAQEFPEQFIGRSQEQAAARQSELTRVFGTADDVAALTAERNAVTKPMREDALAQANVYGQTAPRLQQEIAERVGTPGSSKGLVGALQGQGRTASEAAQATNRANTWTPIPGYPRFPGRYSPNMERAIEFSKTAKEFGDIASQRKAEVDFKKMQLQSLADEGFFPLEINKIIGKIEKSMKTPGERSNELLQNAQASLRDKLTRYADENGIIPSQDLYNIRKEIGEDIQAFLSSRGNPSFGAQATAVEKALKAQLDEAITTASGSNLWKDYLTNFAKYSEKINQMKVGQELQTRLGGTFDKEAAGRFAQGIQSAPTLIKRATGQNRYEKIEQILTPEQTASVNRVYADLLRKSKAEELAKKTKVTGKVPFESEQELPQLLSRAATIGRSILDTLRRGSQKELDKKVAELMLEPQKLATFLESMPKKEAGKVGEALAARMSPELRQQFVFFLQNVTPKEGEVTRGLIQQMFTQ